MKRIVIIMLSVVFVFSLVVCVFAAFDQFTPVSSSDFSYVPVPYSTGLQLYAYGYRNSSYYQTSPIQNSSNYPYLQIISSGQQSIPVSGIIGIPVNYSSGTTVSVSFSGLDLLAYYRRPNSSAPVSTTVSTNFQDTYPVNSSYVLMDLPDVSFTVRDQDGQVLALSSSSSGSFDMILDHDITFIGLSIDYYMSYSASYYQHLYADISSFDITSVAVSTQGILLDIRTTLNNIYDAIIALDEANQSNLMTQFENRYLERQEDQLNQVEDMLTSANPALPNNGDVAGFVSDISDGLGLSGSSFNPSDFSSATSKFGDTSSTSAGGPWEFFSQSVLDSLSGDTYSVGLSDDDYIYAWLDDMIRWRDSAFGGG